MLISFKILSAHCIVMVCHSFLAGQHMRLFWFSQILCPMASLVIATPLSHGNLIMTHISSFEMLFYHIFHKIYYMELYLEIVNSRKQA